MLRGAARVAAPLVAAGIAGIVGVRFYLSKEMREQVQSASHTEDSALKQLIVYKGMAFMGRQFSRNLEREAATADSVQANLLSALLRTHQNSALGVAWNLRLISGVDSFRDEVPITTYDDYRPFVQRLVAGESNALVSQAHGIKVRPFH